MPLHMPKIVSIGMRASTSAYGLCSTTSALALLAVPAALAVVVLLCCGNNNEAATEERVDAATPENEEAFTAGSNAALNWWRRPLLIQVGLGRRGWPRAVAIQNGGERGCTAAAATRCDYANPNTLSAQSAVSPFGRLWRGDSRRNVPRGVNEWDADGWWMETAELMGKLFFVRFLGQMNLGPDEMDGGQPAGGCCWGHAWMELMPSPHWQLIVSLAEIKGRPPAERCVGRLNFPPATEGTGPIREFWAFLPSPPPMSFQLGQMFRRCGSS